jgi:hypothetical protein
MSILQVRLLQNGPVTAEVCYRLIYDPVQKTVDNFDYGDGITTAGYPFNLFLATTHEEITDFCTTNGISFDPNNFPNVDFSH